MPKLKPEEMDRRRRHIVDAARTCFVRGGIERTTTDDICKHAGLSKGAVYGHFASKDELILEVLDAGADAMDHLRRPASLKEFRTLLANYPFVAFRDQDVARLEFEMMTRAFADPAVHERLGRNVHALDAALRTALHSLVSQGRVRLLITEKAAARLIVFSLFGAFWWRTVQRKSGADAQRDALDVLLTSILEPLDE